MAAQRGSRSCFKAYTEKYSIKFLLGQLFFKYFYLSSFSFAFLWQTHSFSASAFTLRSFFSGLNPCFLPAFPSHVWYTPLASSYFIGKLGARRFRVYNLSAELLEIDWSAFSHKLNLIFEISLVLPVPPRKYTGYNYPCLRFFLRYLVMKICCGRITGSTSVLTRAGPEIFHGGCHGTYIPEETFCFHSLMGVQARWSTLRMDMTESQCFRVTNT